MDEGFSTAQLIKQLQQYVDVFVICGGDGTIQEAVNAAMGLSTTIAILPVGSGNDFSKTLGLPKSIVQNLKIIKQGRTQKCDLIRVNDHLSFINTFGIGFDGQTNYYATKSKFKGRLKYLIAGLKTLISAPPFEAVITTDNTTMNICTLMIVMANGKWEGGTYLVSPSSDPFDGIAEVIIPASTSRVRMLYEFARLSFGYTFSSGLILTRAFNRLHIKLIKKAFLHADGEVFPTEMALKFEVIRSDVSLIIPSF